MADTRALAARIVDEHTKDPSRTPHAIARELGCSHVTARRVMAERGLVPKREAVERGHVAAAMAERAAPAKPLVVEPLPEKLKRLVPGARLEHDPLNPTPWVVWRGLSVLACAHSAREAVDKAVTLYGGR